MAICLVCGRFDELNIKGAISKGWVFTRCPECQRGTPLDILLIHLSKTTDEQYFEGFCQEHWFKDSGICAYCRIRREEASQSVA